MPIEFDTQPTLRMIIYYLSTHNNNGKYETTYNTNHYD